MAVSRRSSWILYLATSLIFWSPPTALFLGRTIVPSTAPQRKSYIVRSAGPVAGGDFAAGQEVILLAPPAVAGKTATIVEPVQGGAYAVCLESGCVFNILSQNIEAAASQLGAETMMDSARQSPLLPRRNDFRHFVQEFVKMVKPAGKGGATKSKGSARAPTDKVGGQLGEDEEDLLDAGQEVAILAPHGLVGNTGTIVRSMPDDTYAVRLQSGTVFTIQRKDLELPKAMTVSTLLREAWKSVARKVHLIRVAHAPAVKKATGSLLREAKRGWREAKRGWSQVCGKTAPETEEPVADTAAAPASADPALEIEDEYPFTAGQEVVLLAPPAMKGKTGVVLAPANGDAYSVQLDSGTKFNINADNMRAVTGSGIGGGGHGFSGSGGGQGGDGRPPDGVGSGSSFEPGSSQAWKELLALVCAIATVVFLCHKAYKKLKSKSQASSPRWRRVDRRSLYVTGSSVGGPVAAVLLLAVTVFVLIPKLFGWLRAHLPSKKAVVVQIAEDVQTDPVEVLVDWKEAIADDEVWRYAWGLSAAAAIIFIMWIWRCCKLRRPHVRDAEDAEQLPLPDVQSAGQLLLTVALAETSESEAFPSRGRDEDCPMTPAEFQPSQSSMPETAMTRHALRAAKRAASNASNAQAAGHEESQKADATWHKRLDESPKVQVQALVAEREKAQREAIEQAQKAASKSPQGDQRPPQVEVIPNTDASPPVQVQMLVSEYEEAREKAQREALEEAQRTPNKSHLGTQRPLQVDVIASTDESTPVPVQTLVSEYEEAWEKAQREALEEAQRTASKLPQGAQPPPQVDVISKVDEPPPLPVQTLVSEYEEAQKALIMAPEGVQGVPPLVEVVSEADEHPSAQVQALIAEFEATARLGGKTSRITHQTLRDCEEARGSTCTPEGAQEADEKPLEGLQECDEAWRSASMTPEGAPQLPPAIDVMPDGDENRSTQLEEFEEAQRIASSAPDCKEQVHAPLADAVDEQPALVAEFGQQVMSACMAEGIQDVYAMLDDGDDDDEQPLTRSRAGSESLGAASDIQYESPVRTEVQARSCALDDDEFDIIGQYDGLSSAASVVSEMGCSSCSGATVPPLPVWVATPPRTQVATPRLHELLSGRPRQVDAVTHIEGQTSAWVRTLIPHDETSPRKTDEEVVARVHFEIEFHAQVGDRLLIIGGDSSLGMWDPDKTKVELRTNNESYPVWSGTWYSDGSLAFLKYKLAIRKASGEIVSERITHRTMYVTPGDVTVKLIFNRSCKEDAQPLAAVAG
eukprot:TRINITY_DN561_c0_g1_i1.p1 TRINITY_DN561_c0_g1~~TRINITY_DN561_c0_g1_i1.p1  ORF type:complete len:1261 (-),score=241.91 TRINITY_DN561_c0_g1_i1:25-3807(-)